MAYPTYDENIDVRRGYGFGSLAAIIALFAVIAAFAIAGASAPHQSTKQGAAPTAVEDWHGNVRRSHWER